MPDKIDQVSQNTIRNLEEINRSRNSTCSHRVRLEEIGVDDEPPAWHKEA